MSCHSVGGVGRGMSGSSFHSAVSCGVLHGSSTRNCIVVHLAVCGAGARSSKNSDNAAAKFALQALEKRIASLEGGSAAVAVSYGHAAQLLAFSNIFQLGDHFIATVKLYRGTYTQFCTALPSVFC